MNKRPDTINCNNSECDFVMVVQDPYSTVWPDNETDIKTIHNKNDMNTEEYSHICHECGHYSLNTHPKPH